MHRAPGYASDRRWADRFIPEIKQIIGPYLLREAPIEIDQKEATDLIVLQVEDKRIAARMRAWRYFRDYPDDFTIRRARDNNVKTELAKIKEGFGDWLFYGFATEDDNSIHAWRIIDLKVFRLHCDQWHCYEDRSNGDGTHLRIYDSRRFPASLMIAEGPPEVFGAPADQYALLYRTLVGKHGPAQASTLLHSSNKLLGGRSPKQAIVDGDHALAKWALGC